jgi:AcrR family transcriptional regulator
VVSNRRAQVGSYERARNPAHKQERRAALLEAARTLVTAKPVAAFTMAALAEALGMSKGALYIYFRTKEEVFLALLEEELCSWLDETDRRLAGRRGRLTAEELARITVAALAGRTCLIRLFVVLESILEHNVELARVVAWKRALLARLARTAALVEAGMPALPHGSGLRVLFQMRALITGLYQMTDVSPVAAEAYANQDLAIFRLDFKTELEIALGALLAGWTRGPKAETKGKQTRVPLHR